MPSSRSSFESGSSPRGRRHLLLALGAVALLVLIGGFVALGMIEVAPQPQSVEKVIPNDRLSR